MVKNTQGGNKSKGFARKNLTKKDTRELKEKHGEKGIQKRLSEERKQRVRTILNNVFPDFDTTVVDSDITDAIGIGLWYGVSNGFRTL